MDHTNFLRVSISLLVPLINSTYVGIFDKKNLLSRNEKQITALGGVSLIRKKSFLMKQYGAFDFEGDDARFKVPIDNIEDMLEHFRNLHSDLFETDPRRELVEELSRDGKILDAILSGNRTYPILDESWLRTAEFEYLGRYEETSESRVDGKTPTFRIMHNFRLVVSAIVQKKICDQPFIKPLTLLEIQKRMTTDGILIKDNIIDITELIPKRQAP